MNKTYRIHISNAVLPEVVMNEDHLDNGHAKIRRVARRVHPETHSTQVSLQAHNASDNHMVLM